MKPWEVFTAIAATCLFVVAMAGPLLLVEQPPEPVHVIGPEARGALPIANQPPGTYPSSVMFVDASGAVYYRYGYGIPGTYPAASFAGPIPYTESWRAVPQPVLIFDPYHSRPIQ